MLLRRDVIVHEMEFQIVNVSGNAYNIVTVSFLEEDYNINSLDAAAA